MARLQKACRNYNAWKARHSPEHKPWLFPDQNSLPPLNPADIGNWEVTESPVLDERDAVAIVSDGGEEDEDSAVTHPGSAAAAIGNSSVTVEELSVPMAATEPAVADTAVAAEAN